MAGYILYSLDWDRFQSLVNNPTRKQLLKFAELISDGLDQHDGEFEDVGISDRSRLAQRTGRVVRPGQRPPGDREDSGPTGTAICPT